MLRVHLGRYLIPSSRFHACSNYCERRLLASSCVSVRIQQLGSHWLDFHENWYLRIVRKYVEKIKFCLKSDKNQGYFTLIRMYIYDNISLISSYEWEVFRMKLVDKIKTRFSFNIFFFRKLCRLWDNVEKHKMLCCVVTGTMVTLTRRIATLYVHCPSHNTGFGT
jgi:hypothetical protein